MKGIFIKKPLIYELEIYQESFTQGSVVNGNIIIKNQSTDDIDLSKYQISLQEGVHRKIKKAEKASFKQVATSVFLKDTLKAEEELKQEFSFSLCNNAMITDKTQSLFILCGPKNDVFQGGFLEISTKMHNVFSFYLDMFTNFQKFKLKSVKSKNGLLNAKMIPPASKQLTAVDSLDLELSLEDSVLSINHKFKVNILRMNEGMLKATPETVSIKTTMSQKEYLLFENNYDQEKILNIISDTIEQVLLKVKIV